MIKHFINLTNGIEWLDNFSPNDVNFIRIQSTTLEHKNWNRLFLELDNNLLMWLALGWDCRIYDFGTNREWSKTIYMGLPIIRYCLNKFWLNYEMNHVPIDFSGRNFKNYVDKEIYFKCFSYSEENLRNFLELKIKYSYFKKYLATMDRIKLVGYSKSTENDSNVGFYKCCLIENGFYGE